MSQGISLLVCGQSSVAAPTMDRSAAALPSGLMAQEGRLRHHWGGRHGLGLRSSPVPPFGLAACPHGSGSGRRMDVRQSVSCPLESGASAIGDAVDRRAQAERNLEDVQDHPAPDCEDHDPEEAGHLGARAWIDHTTVRAAELADVDPVRRRDRSLVFECLEVAGESRDSAVGQSGRLARRRCHGVYVNRWETRVLIDQKLVSGRRQDGCCPACGSVASAGPCAVICRPGIPAARPIASRACGLVIRRE